MNKFCSLLWLNNTYPTKKIAEECWKNFVLENKSVTERELALLSMNQRKLLMLLAMHGPTQEPASKAFSEYFNLASSSANQAVKVLLEKDYIYIDQEGYYKILDPLIKAVLA
ncbi:MAG: hypothetical protein ACKOAD_05430 [Gammaproteobacteria bacterium]